MDSAVKPRQRPKRTGAARWREYERRKAEFLRDANSKPGDYEHFIRQLGKKLGL